MDPSKFKERELDIYGPVHARFKIQNLHTP